MTPKYIVIHHSKTQHGNLAMLKEYHMTYNGYPDIGYHYVICNGNGGEDGLVEMGISDDIAGNHCANEEINQNSLGICLIGNFDVVKPTQKQMLSLFHLLVKLVKEYNIPVENIIGHSDADKDADCPGKLLNISELRKSVKNTIEYYARVRKEGGM